MPIIINDDPPAASLPTVADLTVGDGFLWDGGKLHVKWSDTVVLCYENGSQTAVADYGTNGVVKRKIIYHHAAP